VGDDEHRRRVEETDLAGDEVERPGEGDRRQHVHEQQPPEHQGAQARRQAEAAEGVGAEARDGEHQQRAADARDEAVGRELAEHRP
jgi:hypothetical protein